MYVFHKTICGYSHIKKNIACEDFSGSFADDRNSFFVASIADGHGEKSCLRSGRGAEFAVQIALKYLQEFAEYYENVLAEGDASEFIRSFCYPKGQMRIIGRLTDCIISKWNAAIKEDLTINPLSEEELTLAGELSESYRNGERLAHIYGTTLIAALWLKDYLILIQQGDGRCDVFFEDGSVGQPIPWDDRCFQNVTTSMCDTDAAASIRHCVLDLRERPVMGCYMGSDGVEDSFSNMEGTHNFYRGLVCALFQCGVDEFGPYLEKALPELSQNGSGDDISVAGIVNTRIIERYVERFQKTIRVDGLLEKQGYYERKLISMERKHAILKKRADNSRYALAQKEEEWKAIKAECERESEKCLALEQEYAQLEIEYQECVQENRSIQSQTRGKRRKVISVEALFELPGGFKTTLVQLEGRLRCMKKELNQRNEQLKARQREEGIIRAELNRLGESCQSILEEYEVYNQKYTEIEGCCQQASKELAYVQMEEDSLSREVENQKTPDGRISDKCEKKESCEKKTEEKDDETAIKTEADENGKDMDGVQTQELLLNLNTDFKLDSHEIQKNSMECAGEEDRQEILNHEAEGNPNKMSENDDKEEKDDEMAEEME